MKKMLATLLCLLPVLGFSQPAPEKGDSLLMSMNVICGGDKLLDKVMIGYGEMPMMKMDSIRIINKETVRFMAVLFVNEKTHSWTLVEDRGSELYCVIGAGSTISPIFLENQRNPEMKRNYY